MVDSPALVVLLTGPSGAGKSSLARRSGLPVLSLDRFYKNGNDPSLPRYGESVDWDDPSSWHHEDALDAVHRLAVNRRARVPMYDIAQNRRVGDEAVEVGSAPAFVAEGIFAAQLVAGCRALGILADALCLHQNSAVTFYRRLARDLREGRKSPLTLTRRGVALTFAEAETVDEQVAQGAHLCRADEALYRIRLAVYSRRLVPDLAATAEGRPRDDASPSPSPSPSPVV